MKRNLSRSLGSKEASKENVDHSLKAMNASTEKMTPGKASRGNVGSKSVDSKDRVKSVVKSRDSSKEISSTKSSLSWEGFVRRTSLSKEAVKERKRCQPLKHLRR